MRKFKEMVSVMKKLGVKVTRKRNGTTELRYPNPSMYNEFVSALEEADLCEFEENRSELIITLK